MDELLLVRDVRVISRHLLEHLIPEDHAVLHTVRFRGTGDLRVPVLTCVLEGVAHDTLGACSGEDHRLDGDLLLCPLVHASSHTSILPLGVLPDADHVYFCRPLADQGTAHTWQQAHRPQIDVLVKSLTKREQQAPQREMVRHPWVADGTEQDAIKASPLKDGQPILRHHVAFSEVALGAPVKLLHSQLEAAMELGENTQGLDAFRDDLWPNAITR